MAETVRYRFVTTACNPKDRINLYRLVRNWGRGWNSVGHMCYRVHVPADMELEWIRKDRCYITKDTRTIEELGYDIILNTWDGKRKILKAGANIEAEVRAQHLFWREAMRRAAQESTCDTDRGYTLAEFFAGR